VVRVPVGRNAAIDALNAHRPEQIALAGEGTGAVMMPQFRFVYDGIATMLTLLEKCAARQQPLSQLVAALPGYSMLKGEVPLNRHRIPQLLELLATSFGEVSINRQDGLRVDLPSGRWGDNAWFHVRVSQTEPFVRVIAEARGAAPQDLFDEVMETTRAHA
jgi:phosphomannomutase